MIIERREHKRNIVSGKAGFATPQGTVAGEVVSLSRGGMLILCKGTLAIGTDREISFTVEGHCVTAQVRVVRVEAGVLGLAFLEEPEGLEEMLLWLETAFVMNLMSG